MISTTPPARTDEIDPTEREPDTYENRAAALYIRLALGFGIPFGPDVADHYAGRDGEPLHFAGYSLATDWMAGAAVLPWLVVGLGVASDTVMSGTVKNADDQERELEHSLSYMAFGGFADVYFTPPAGLHVQALVGVGHLARSDDFGRGTTGLGLVLGAGYEVAVARRWNLGVLGRFALSPMGRDEVDGEDPSPTIFEPSALVTATFRPELE